MLQTTCYNFSSTGTTAELCAGVVKAQGLYEKNPAQHFADLVMLQEQREFQSAFYDANGQPKQVDCVRVDGSSDEGPSHEDGQYWWTERHYKEKKRLQHYLLLEVVAVAISTGWNCKMDVSPEPMPILSYHQHWLDHALILKRGLLIKKE